MNFYVKHGPSIGKIYVEFPSESPKTPKDKKIHELKLGPLHTVFILIEQYKYSIFLLSLSKVFDVDAPDKADAPTSKKYVTAQPNSFQRH